MIDFHTHILPGIDDGSRNVFESTEMLREEMRQGVSTVFLTPHYYADENSPIVFLKKRNNAWRNLEEQLQGKLPRIRLGAEVQYFEGICAVEDICCLKILGTDYLLLEMPFHRWSNRVLGDVLDLNDRRGMQIVLAHIERYMAWQEPDTWETLRRGGVLMQSNVSFFANWKTRFKAQSMLKAGKIDFLGSDCHNMQTRYPNWNHLPHRVAMQYDGSEKCRALEEMETDGIHLDMT